MKKIFGQHENETIYIYVRRHLVSIVPFLLVVALFLLAGVGLFVYTVFFANVSPDANNMMLFAASFVVSATLTIFLIGWIDFYFDIHIVTNERVIDIDQNGLFNRRVSELSLDNVEDASNSTVGILPNIFNYGNVEIQTAGTKPNFVFEFVAHPREMAEIIIDLAEQYRQNGGNHEGPRCRFKKIIDGKLFLETGNNDSQPGKVAEIIPTQPPQSNFKEAKMQELEKEIEKEASGEVSKDELNRGGKIEF